jgi:hypothetical protein
MTTRCMVEPLLHGFTKDQLLGEYSELFQKMVTRCKCPEHITQNPVELPNIIDLNQQLTMAIGDLLDFGLDHMPEDATGNSRALVAFIQQYCLSDSPNSLFSIIENLEKIYGQQIENNE